MIVVCDKPGRLGNRLFVFANLITCAAEHGLRVANPSFDEYAEYFRGTRDDLLCRYPAGRSPGARSRWARRALYRAGEWASRMSMLYPSIGRALWTVLSVGGRRLDLSDGRFVELARRRRGLLLRGWMVRSGSDQLRKHADRVRQHLRPIEPIEQAAAALTARARHGCDVLVGVHIRHGDYRTWRDGKHFFELREYAGLMRRVESLWPGRRVGFLVCSNESQNPAGFAGLGVTLGGRHFVEDLYALADCDYLIGPPSTFTQWASFYGLTPLYVIEAIEQPVGLDDFQIAWPSEAP